MDKADTLIASIKDTTTHITKVGDYIDILMKALKERKWHDGSKLVEPELNIFAEYGPKLKTTKYGSEEYKTYLGEMGKALKHHYESNRHHPEHFEKGISGMNLIDLLEMVCDWKAASERTKDGDFHSSLVHNRTRFGLCHQLYDIIANTAELFEKGKKRNECNRS
ncbi:MAG: DUF5662 family protein [Candidatus Hodarchaeales archaeon]|jgi:hypothetical protein